MPADAPPRSARQRYDLLPDVRKIAFLRPSAVGDFVFALPCLHALKIAYPQARITYLGKPWHAEFLRDRPSPVDEVGVVPPCSGITLPPDANTDAGVVEQWIAQMRESSFDLAIQAHGGGKYSNPFLRGLQTRLTIGLRSTEAEALDRWCHFGPLQNRRLQLLEVAALAGANTLTMGAELCATQQDMAAADGVLPQQPGERLVLIQPGASDRRRRWDVARFAAVADALAQTGATIAVNGTVQEAATVRAVCAQMRYPAADLSGKLSLSGLCGLLARAELLVSNDTGPLHLALALGTPAVGIYWLTNLLESGPLNQQWHRPLMATRVNCPACGVENLKTRCAHEFSFVDDIGVEAVTQEALVLWREVSQQR